MTELCTWDKFVGARQSRYDTGLLSWEPEAVAGYEFDVWETLANVEVGDFDGAVLAVCADTFGTIVRRLVEESAEVRPGQHIAEVAYRDPTLAEYTKVWEQARRAEDRSTTSSTSHRGARSGARGRDGTDEALPREPARRDASAHGVGVAAGVRPELVRHRVGGVRRARRLRVGRYRVVSAGEIVRVVTDEEVGELGRYWWRPNAERDARTFNAGEPVARPVEYVVERRGLVHAIVAYQALLVER